MFVEERVVDVSCGRNHTAAASASGRVFCWGDNTDFQCGVDGLQVVVHPLNIPVITHSDGNVKQFCSESHHTEKLTGNRDSANNRDDSESNVIGRMCSQPDCCHSQACHASPTGCSGLLVSAKIVHVSCGWTHTAALANSGKLWSWGTGIQVGIEESVSVPVPYPVEFPAGRQVISVSCGGQHTVALTVQHEASKFNAATDNEGGTSKYTDGMGQKTSELIRLSNVPPEAKKSAARHSASDQQKSDTTSDTEKDQPVAVTDSTGINIPMHNLASSTLTESRSDEAEVNCDVKCDLLASTCIDDVCDAETAPDCDMSTDIHSENYSTIASDTVDQSCTDSNVQNNQTVTLSDASYAGSSNVPKSRSSFLDETEAKLFLEKQMCDTGSSVAAAESASSKGLAKTDKKDPQDGAASMSPFAKTVESLLQHVPSSPVVQEYVSNLTQTVVSNLRTSVDRRLNYVTSRVELSLSAIASLSKAAQTGETEVTSAFDDTALLERLALTNCVSNLQWDYEFCGGKNSEYGSKCTEGGYCIVKPVVTQIGLNPLQEHCEMQGDQSFHEWDQQIQLWYLILPL